MGCGMSKDAQIKPTYSDGNKGQSEKRLNTGVDPEKMRAELIKWVEDRNLIQDHWFVELMTNDEIKDFIGVFSTFRCYKRVEWEVDFNEEWDKFWLTGSGRRWKA